MRRFKKQLAIASLVAAVIAPVATDAQAWWGGPWGGGPGWGGGGPWGGGPWGGGPWGGYPGWGGGPWDGYGSGRGRMRGSFDMGGFGNGWMPWNTWW
jgi:hypothetical protein